MRDKSLKRVIVVVNNYLADFFIIVFLQFSNFIFSLLTASFGFVNLNSFLFWSNFFLSGRNNWALIK